jgi:hypothetical protein
VGFSSSKGGSSRLVESRLCVLLLLSANAGECGGEGWHLCGREVRCNVLLWVGEEGDECWRGGGVVGECNFLLVKIFFGSAALSSG